ncbi:transcription factor Spi-C [Erethizon dorsatum]
MHVYLMAVSRHGCKEDGDFRRWQRVTPGSDGQTCVEQDKLGQAFEDAFEVLRQHSAADLQASPDYKSCLALLNHWPPLRAGPSGPWALSMEEPICGWRSVLVSRRRLRLFEYLHESLCDPEMASCIQWVDRARGIFQFVSKNKERLAELWGRRKGNRKPMTYQKMARALRNYGRTGEVTKVRRKLTYQFSEATLQRLAPGRLLGKEVLSAQGVQPQQEHLAFSSWSMGLGHPYSGHHVPGHPVYEDAHLALPRGWLSH